VAKKELVASAITRAQADLAAALCELEKISRPDAPSVAFASHALNNYLTVTGGAVELVLKRLAEHPDAQVRGWLEGVQHATNLMAHIVSQLMGASAINQARLRFEKADLSLLVQRMCDYYERLAGRKSIRLKFEASVDVPSVWTDLVAAASVLDNLLSNAVKYSQPGKQIRVLLRRDEDRAVCEVQDEGPGLSQEDLIKLFQSGAELTPKPTGGEHSTGYGLAVAKELVDKLGGEIWCESLLGQGSRFFFRLPAYRESAQSSSTSFSRISG
jgi:signal transduction histidine kinase